jgi:hypothetical protein
MKMELLEACDRGEKSSRLIQGYILRIQLKFIFRFYFGKHSIFLKNMII